MQHLEPQMCLCSPVLSLCSPSWLSTSLLGYASDSLSPRTCHHARKLCNLGGSHAMMYVGNMRAYLRTHGRKCESMSACVICGVPRRPAARSSVVPKPQTTAATWGSCASWSCAKASCKAATGISSRPKPCDAAAAASVVIRQARTTMRVRAILTINTAAGRPSSRKLGPRRATCATRAVLRPLRLRERVAEDLGDTTARTICVLTSLNNSSHPWPALRRSLKVIWADLSVLLIKFGRVLSDLAPVFTKSGQRWAELEKAYARFGQILVRCKPNSAKFSNDRPKLAEVWLGPMLTNVDHFG